MAMGKLLWEVKGGGQGQAISKSEVQAAADGILQPLMDLLDGKLMTKVERRAADYEKPFSVMRQSRTVLWS